MQDLTSEALRHRVSLEEANFPRRPSSKIGLFDARTRETFWRPFVREFCVEQLCIAMTGDANHATDAPVTG
jgi:hypothetical protein